MEVTTMLFAIPNLWQLLCEGWVLPAYRRQDLTFFVAVCLIEGASRFADGSTFDLSVRSGD
jgi:hypothetical protein